MIPLCLVFGCPWADELLVNALNRAVKAEEEVARLQQRMIDKGIDYGGSIYVEGQRP
jgi:hypothetical protein